MIMEIDKQIGLITKIFITWTALCFLKALAFVVRLTTGAGK